MEWRGKDLLAERTIDALPGPRSVLPPPSVTAEPSQARARQPSPSIRRTLSAVTGVLEASSGASPRPRRESVRRFVIRAGRHEARERTRGATLIELCLYAELLAEPQGSP